MNCQGSKKYYIDSFSGVNWTNASIMTMLVCPYPKTNNSLCQSSRIQMTQFSPMNYLWQALSHVRHGYNQIKNNSKNVRSRPFLLHFTGHLKVWEVAIKNRYWWSPLSSIYEILILGTIYCPWIGTNRAKQVGSHEIK